MLRDSWLVALRALRPIMRSPLQLIFSLIQPLFFLLLFGPLLQPLGGSLGAPGGNSWQLFVPGLLIQLTVLSAGLSGITVVLERQSGALERMRVSPLSRVALLFGRVLKDTVVLLVQAILLLVVGVLMGLRASVPGALIGLLLAGLAAIAFAAASNAIALRTADQEYLFMPIMAQLTVLLVLLSGLLLPMSLAPQWLQWLSLANPLTYVADAERALFAGQLASVDVLVGVLVAAGFAVLGMVWGTRTFQRQSA